MPIMDRHGKPVKVIELAQEVTKQNTRGVRLLNKAEQEVFVCSSYNPIMNLNGEPYKIVAYLQQVIIKKNGRHKDKAAIEATDEKAS